MNLAVTEKEDIQKKRRELKENILVESFLNFTLTCISLNPKNLTRIYIHEEEITKGWPNW